MNNHIKGSTLLQKVNLLQETKVLIAPWCYTEEIRLKSGQIITNSEEMNHILRMIPRNNIYVVKEREFGEITMPADRVYERMIKNIPEDLATVSLQRSYENKSVREIMDRYGIIVTLLASESVEFWKFFINPELILTLSK